MSFSITTGGHMSYYYHFRRNCDILNSRGADLSRVQCRERPEEVAMKTPYTVPHLKKIGSIADLTQTGITFDGDDAKGGSAASQGE